MEKIGVKKTIKQPISTKVNQTEKILVENFVALQKVMVDLSEKFTNLSSQLSQLLKLFEISAKTLAEKGLEDNQEIVKKLDALLDQNKIIAKGITLLHEETEEIKEHPEPMRPQHPQIPKQIPMPKMPPMIKKPLPPKMPQAMQTPSTKEEPTNMQGYQKSISSSKK